LRRWITAVVEFLKNVGQLNAYGALPMYRQDGFGMTDARKYMTQAIAAARHCSPTNPALTPRVGVVIVKGEDVLAVGHRGEHDHAEFSAFGQVLDKSDLIGATLFTTLEPCTGAVRREPHLACTNLVIQHKIKKVYIGMLDPNQGVCGKGVIELQDHNIDVSLFEPELVAEIGALNAEFVRAQRQLGVTILSPREGDVLQTHKTRGNHTFRCKTVNPPGQETWVVVGRDGQWWPQFNRLARVGSSDEYEFVVNFGSYGRHDVHVVRVSDLGSLLFEYYKTTSSRNVERRNRIRKAYPDVPDQIFQGDYPGIPMATPPRGLDIQVSISIVIEDPRERPDR
jgi:pyrimidine deaminase RibD-like protein